MIYRIARGSISYVTDKRACCAHSGDLSALSAGSRGLELQGRKTCVRPFSREHVNETYMPMSAMMISDDGSLVRKRMFSARSSPYIQDLQEQGRDANLKQRWVRSWSCKYLPPDRNQKIELGKNIFSLARGITRGPMYRWLKEDQRTVTASRFENCPRWLIRLQSSPPTASSKAR
jgi:hypothetical protein